MDEACTLPKRRKPPRGCGSEGGRESRSIGGRTTDGCKDLKAALRSTADEAAAEKAAALDAERKGKDAVSRP